MMIPGDKARFYRIVCFGCNGFVTNSNMLNYFLPVISAYALVVFHSRRFAYIMNQKTHSPLKIKFRGNRPHAAQKNTLQINIIWMNMRKKRSVRSSELNRKRNTQLLYGAGC
jgi:hypothetical protein